MHVDPKTLSAEESYKLMTGVVVPRPVAWVTSLSPSGGVNLAPFSTFTFVSPKPPMHRGSKGIVPFASAQIRELQTLLARRGHDVGKIDGFLGLKSRAAVKKEQIRLGLPADSYPTPELVQRLQGR